MTNSTELQLRKAPRIFFDQEKCAEYIAHFDAEEIALMHLSSPPGIDFSWWKDPMKPDEAARIRKEEIFKLKMDLIQGFCKRLENNSIIASGSVQFPSTNSYPTRTVARIVAAYIRDRAIGPRGSGVDKPQPALSAARSSTWPKIPKSLQAPLIFASMVALIVTYRFLTH
jgi:hypothetical protein